VAIDMSPMASKVIGTEACIRARGPFGLSKDTKKTPKHFKEGIINK
jgi:hypothetical protein